VARSQEISPPRRPAYFWWLLANVLALCFAVFSWFICLHVFGNPEIPRNYQILAKLHRLPVLKKFPITEIPSGNSRPPKELYAWFLRNNEPETRRLNSLLLRNYLTNFDNPLLLTYIEGDYQIEAVKKMGSSDFFSPGVAVRAQALVKPDDFTKPVLYPVIIEYLFPTSDSQAAAAFKIGSVLNVKKSPNCAAVVHFEKITRNDEPALLLTVVPIAHAIHRSSESDSFQIEPPARLRPAAGFPVFKLREEKPVQTP
jgi:hypothetical protein